MVYTFSINEHRSTVMPNDIPFTSIGTVSMRVPLQGSFCDVRIDHDNGDSSVHTVCADYTLQWPEIGERIRVTGLIRNDRLLTISWERA